MLDIYDIGRINDYGHLRDSYLIRSQSLLLGFDLTRTDFGICQDFITANENFHNYPFTLVCFYINLMIFGNNELINDQKIRLGIKWI